MRSINQQEIEIYSKKLIDLHRSGKIEEIKDIEPELMSKYGEEGLFMVLQQLRNTGYGGTAASIEGRWKFNSEGYWLTHKTPYD